MKLRGRRGHSWGETEEEESKHEWKEEGKMTFTPQAIGLYFDLEMRAI